MKKTKQFPQCWLPVIASVNGEIVHADGENNLTVLDESLETKRLLNPGREFDPDIHTFYDSISGSETVIAAVDQHEVYCYWRHGGREPMVRQCLISRDTYSCYTSFFLKLFLGLPPRG